MGAAEGERGVFVVTSVRDKCDGGSRLEMTRAIERRDGRGVGVDWPSREEVGYGVVGGFGYCTWRSDWFDGCVAIRSMAA